MDTQTIDTKSLLRQASERQRARQPIPLASPRQADSEPQPLKATIQKASGFYLAPAKPKPVDPRTPEEIEAARLKWEEARRRDAMIERRRVWDRLLKKLGPKYDKPLSEVEFYGSEEDQSNQRDIFARVSRFAEAMQANVASGKNLLFVGSRGCGKDYMLANNLKRACACGFLPMWMDGSQLFLQLRDSMNPDASKTEAMIVAELAAAPILAISDPVPAVGNLTPFQATTLLAVIDQRYRADRPTWLTLNVSSRKEAEERMGAMLIDRLFENSEVLFCSWPSYREHVREKSKDR